MRSVNFYFFDSHGGLWRTVHPSSGDHRAVAFGPTGLAREVVLSEVNLHKGEGTAWARAQAVGRVIPAKEVGGFDELAD